MIIDRVTDAGYDQVRITEVLPEELMTGELLSAIYQGRSMPWAWRDVTDGRVVRLVDDFGHRYAYEVKGWDPQRDVFRLQLRIDL